MTAHPIADPWIVAALTPVAAVALTAGLAAVGYAAAMWVGIFRQRRADADLEQREE